LAITSRAIKVDIVTHIKVETPTRIMGKKVIIMIIHPIMNLKGFAVPSAKLIMHQGLVSVSNVVKEYKIPYVPVAV
jgi:hypothetical protein